MAKVKDKEVLVKETYSSQALVIEDMVTDAELGLEDIGAGDVALPFLSILQSGSPQVKRGEQQVEGAVEGDVFNTVTLDVYNGEEGIFVVPCMYKKAYVEWKPREAGGGFVMQHESEHVMQQTRKDAKGRDMLENGNIIVPTAYHYVLLINPVSGDSTRTVIGMSSTQLKKSRRWNAVMTTLKLQRNDGTKFTPAMFSHMYKLTTEAESNELGAWSGWKIEIAGLVPSKEIYASAKKYSADLKSGAIREAAPPRTDFQDSDAPY
jgi:hypothetical protein